MSKSEKRKAPKPNMDALQDAVSRVGKDFVVRFSGSNFIDILTNKACLCTDTVISASLRLYGSHNRLEIEIYGSDIVLTGGTYRLLPEFLIEGEEVEF